MKTALIIGGGFAGCATAHQLALQGGWKVTVVEAQSQLGAGVRTHTYGGHPYTFGPRHFMTDNREVYEFLNSYLPLRRLTHEFLTYIERDNDFYSFPIHRDDIERMPDRDTILDELDHLKGAQQAKNLEEYWLRSVGETLYSKFINDYNKKMWMIESNTALDTFEWSQKVSLTNDREKAAGKTELPKSPIKEGEKHAYEDLYSCYPIAMNGYNDYFDISTAEAEVLLSTTISDYDIPNKTVVVNGEKRSFDIIINTISPDILFDNCHGELPYIGRDFMKIVLPMEQCFPDDVFFLYYANQEPFTRIVEYKKLTNHQSPTTLLGMEIPSMNGKHYPLPIMSEIEKANRYFEMMPDDVYSIGRAGSYDYNIHIPLCFEQAMRVASEL